MANFDGLQLGGTKVAWTPTIAATSGSGVVATINKAVLYRWSRWCWFSLDFTITTAGTGSGFLTATLPVSSSYYANLAGRESGADGRLLQCSIGAGSTLFIVYADTQAYPGQVGKRPIISGMYEA